MLQVIRDVIGITQYNILKSKMAAICFELCQNLKIFLAQFAFENAENSAKMVLVTLIALNTKSLCKALML